MATIHHYLQTWPTSGSQGTYIMFASAMQIRQPTLALKPRGDITRNPKQGYQWPQNRTCVCVRQKYLKKNKHGYQSSLSTNIPTIHHYLQICQPFIIIYKHGNHSSLSTNMVAIHHYLQTYRPFIIIYKDGNHSLLSTNIATTHHYL